MLSLSRRLVEVNAFLQIFCPTYLFYFSQSIFESPPRRPVIGSAFTAYVPGKAGTGANTRGSPGKQYTGLDNLRSRTSYLTSLGSGEDR